MPGPSSRSSTGSTRPRATRTRAKCGSAFIGSCQGLSPSSAQARASCQPPARSPSSGPVRRPRSAGMPASDRTPGPAREPQQHRLGLIVERVTRAGWRPRRPLARLQRRVARLRARTPRLPARVGHRDAARPRRRARTDASRATTSAATASDPAADRGRRRRAHRRGSRLPATWWAAQARASESAPPEQATAHGCTRAARPPPARRPASPGRAPCAPSAVHATRSSGAGSRDLVGRRQVGGRRRRR
jgi:hypothetical protein